MEIPKIMLGQLQLIRFTLDLAKQEYMAIALLKKQGKLAIFYEHVTNKDTMNNSE